MKSIKELKIIELASVLAGPLVGTFFAEAGARVIKFEKPGNGDITRSWKNEGDRQNSRVSSYFASANYGKEIRSLDLGNEEDIASLYAELEDADIILSNFKHGDDKKFHLEKQKIAEKFPHLIQGRISGFSEESDRTAFDIVLQAETGYIHLCGTPTQHAKLPVAMIDELAAHQLKEGLLIALMERMLTGKGSVVEVSLYDAALSGLTNQASSWLMNQVEPEAMGMLHPSICPYGEYLLTSDQKKIVLAIGNDKQFAHLCEILHMEEASHDPRFIDNASRVRNRVALQDLFNEHSIHFNRDMLFQKLIEQRIPAGRILTLKEVFEDPNSWKCILEEEIEQVPTRRVSGNVFRIQEIPGQKSELPV
ncbi:MAG: CoA transferase [Bacteroidetes bacterium]|nr:CoA transferase [Bacteroidota bacterium]